MKILIFSVKLNYSINNFHGMVSYPSMLPFNMSYLFDENLNLQKLLRFLLKYTVQSQERKPLFVDIFNGYSYRSGDVIQ